MILATYTLWRLPRIRGDRPEAHPNACIVGMATPHTRGSTCRRSTNSGSSTGYPAYAGIDPLITTNGKLTRWLPRIRGDRPWEIDVISEEGKATPHTRGSTRLERFNPATSAGYPAYAGIDLREERRISQHQRLPRIRGDRPLFLGDHLLLIQATPHTRGSTKSPQSAARCATGYPAYAGIDLSKFILIPPKDWLPRIRGDRPPAGFLPISVV